MFSRSFQVGLPRQVSAYYLLFALAAIVWLGVGVYHASNKVTHDRSESSSLRVLGHVTRSLGLEYLQHGEANLQPLVETIRNRHPMAYLAVVGTDGEYLAHSAPELVGTTATEPAGASESWGDVQKVRFVNEDSVVLSEFRTPLCAGNRHVGTIRMAIVEPSSWRSFLVVARYAPIVIAGPTAFILLGVAVLGRLTRPVADIEKQLRVAATASSITGCHLTEIEESGPAAIGWNRLIDDRAGGLGQTDLHERLRESLGSLQASRLEAVLNGLSDGIATTDHDGRVTYSNMALATLVRWNPPDVSNGSAKRHHGATDSGRFVDALKKTWALPDKTELLDPEAELRPVIVELENLERDERRVLRVTRTPLDGNDSREPDGHLWTLRDVTQQKMAEEMRTQFVDTATHELRTPLANIKAYAETLVLADVTDLDQQKEFLNTINTEATRLARFVDDLLSVSSMEVGALSLSKQTTDVERLFAEVVNKIRPQMREKGITFDTVFPDKLTEASLDKDKIAAMLVNLLGNATKYTPEGGQVVLRVNATDEFLEINVEDTGYGIAKDDLPKLFDKFFRSSDARVQETTGTGLGLSLASEVVRLHGGKITVDSDFGKGTTFSVSLPWS